MQRRLINFDTSFLPDYGGGEEENGGGGGGDDPNAYGVPQGCGEFQKVGSLLVDGGDRFGVSAVAFDLQEELIWMGNRGVSGRIRSYHE